MKFKLHSLALAVAAAFATLAQAVHARTPTELLFRPLMRGPIMTRAVSAANQWAGRTTISSGSASQVVSTTNVNSDSIFNLALQAALPAGYTTQGQISFANSAAVTGTASTTAVYSGYVINISLQVETSVVSAGAGINIPLRINSIVDGVSFAISTVNSQPIGLTAPIVNWEIPRAKVAGVKVNTISPGAHFILGWSDGIAKPNDVVVMWEIRRTT